MAVNSHRSHVPLILFSWDAASFVRSSIDGGAVAEKLLSWSRVGRSSHPMTCDLSSHGSSQDVSGESHTSAHTFLVDIAGHNLSYNLWAKFLVTRHQVVTTVQSILNMGKNHLQPSAIGSRSFPLLAAKSPTLITATEGKCLTFTFGVCGPTEPKVFF